MTETTENTEMIELDPKFLKFRRVFLDLDKMESLTEDELALYKVFHAGAVFYQQFTQAMAIANKIDPEVGKQMYCRIFAEDLKINDGIKFEAVVNGDVVAEQVIENKQSESHIVNGDVISE